MTLEMGKPIAQGEAEVEKCAWACDYYAEHAEALLAEQPRETDASRSYVRFDPLGVVLAVMPWNFPFWQVLPLRRPGADGRQRGRAQARLQRAALRARDRGGLPRRRLSRAGSSPRC